jgi:hypothetical protein
MTFGVGAQPVAGGYAGAFEGFTLKALWMRHTLTAALLVAALIHLLPLSGVLGAERLATLYGVPVADPNLMILMRHRAVLFGLLGVFLGVAAFIPALQGAALVAGMISVVSFLWLRHHAARQRLGHLDAVHPGRHDAAGVARAFAGRVQARRRSGSGSCAARDAQR